MSRKYKNTKFSPDLYFTIQRIDVNITAFKWSYVNNKYTPLISVEFLVNKNNSKSCYSWSGSTDECQDEMKRSNNTTRTWRYMWLDNLFVHTRIVNEIRNKHKHNTTYIHTHTLIIRRVPSCFVEQQVSSGNV